MDENIFIYRIEALRKKSGLTQQELALKMGMTRANYSRLIKRPWTINFRQISNICIALEIELGSLLIDNYDKIENQERLLNEFSELTVSYWIHDYLKEILKLYKHDLNKDSLFIESPDQKQSLIALLVGKVTYYIVTVEVSKNFEGVLIDFFMSRDVAIYYYSKKEKSVRVDLNVSAKDRNYNRTLKKVHPEL